MKAASTDSIHENTRIIYSKAFYNCTSLTSITIPDSVTSIGAQAFWACKNLASVTIPDSVTSIGSSAFYNCTNLASITIPDSVTSIGNNAFDGCTSLAYSQYDNAYYLGNASNPYLVLVKATSTDITSCSIHENTRFIQSHAFSFCNNLISITIPDSVTSIDSYTFWSCRSLTSITIPDSITSIGNNAFDGCTSLNTVYYGGTADDWAGIDISYSNYALTSDTLYYYSETEPAASGNYWHYVDGVPTKW